MRRLGTLDLALTTDSVDWKIYLAAIAKTKTGKSVTYIENLMTGSLAAVRVASSAPWSGAFKLRPHPHGRGLSLS